MDQLWDFRDAKAEFCEGDVAAFCQLVHAQLDKNKEKPGYGERLGEFASKLEAGLFEHGFAIGSLPTVAGGWGSGFVGLDAKRPISRELECTKPGENT